MAEPKPFASLSSSLLARKGAARPAMRRQGHMDSTPNGHAQEDLGWNDMGYDVDPSFEAKSFDSNVRQSPVLSGAIPEVVRQQDELAEKLADLQVAVPGPVADEVPEPVSPLSIKPKAAKPEAVKRVAGAEKTAAVGKRAAFTLRVDPARHLKLRLACAFSNRSAQQIVTEALDDFLASLPEIDDLAGRVPAPTKR